MVYKWFSIVIYLCGLQEYKKLTNEVIKHELLILQTLGFDVQIRHPHPDVVKCTQLVKGMVVLKF